MAIALIVKLGVLDGKGSEFEAAFADQARAVRAAEPGNSLYRLVRSRTDPQKYAVLEIYENEAAFDAHRSAPHMAAGRPRIGPLLAEGTEFEIYDLIE
jgi:quinol monooxygenase YgiN